MFGLASQAESLYSDAFNSLQNVITVETSLYTLFDSFDLWLEPVAGQVRVSRYQRVTVCSQALILFRNRLMMFAVLLSIIMPLGGLAPCRLV